LTLNTILTYISVTFLGFNIPTIKYKYKEA
jgi:hypothetical protein